MHTYIRTYALCVYIYIYTHTNTPRHNRAVSNTDMPKPRAFEYSVLAHLCELCGFLGVEGLGGRVKGVQASKNHEVQGLSRVAGAQQRPCRVAGLSSRASTCKVGCWTAIIFVILSLNEFQMAATSSSVFSLHATESPHL